MLIMFQGRMHKVRGVTKRRGVEHVVAFPVEGGSDVLLTVTVAALGRMAATAALEMTAQREADALITRAMQA